MKYFAIRRRRCAFLAQFEPPDGRRFSQKQRSMKIITIPPTTFSSNSYIITKDNQTAIVIDPSPRAETELSRRGIIPACVLLTHCHFDHVVGVSSLQAQGAKVYCSAEEKPLIGTQADVARLFGAPSPQYAVDETFAKDESKTLCGLQVQALQTAGHTKGSVCYLISDGDDKALFTGDTLFAGTIGRTDFPTGNTATLMQSLKRLKNLSGDYPVYAGHGEETTLQTERESNPFLQE